MIWDSFDAQSIKGKPVASPVTGSKLNYYGGRWIPEVGAGSVVIADDFFQQNVGSSSGTGGFGDSRAWTISYTAGGNVDSYVGGSGTPVDSWGLGYTEIHPVATNGATAALRLSGGASISGNIATLAYDMVFAVKLGQTDANFDVALGLVPGAVAGDLSSSNSIVIGKTGAETSWYGSISNGTAQSKTAALGALSTGWAVFRIRSVSSGVAGFRMASSLAALETATELTLSTNYPISFIAPGFVLIPRANENKYLYVDYVSMALGGNFAR